MRRPKKAGVFHPQSSLPTDDSLEVKVSWEFSVQGVFRLVRRVCPLTLLIIVSSRMFTLVQLLIVIFAWFF
jgi:hypothetical protein